MITDLLMGLHIHLSDDMQENCLALSNIVLF